MIVRCGFIVRIESYLYWLKPTEIQQPSFKDRFFSSAEKISYQEINQDFFHNRFIKRVRSRDEGLNMSGLDFKRILYLFVLSPPSSRTPITMTAPGTWAFRTILKIIHGKSTCMNSFCNNGQASHSRGQPKWAGWRRGLGFSRSLHQLWERSWSLLMLGLVRVKDRYVNL